MKMNHVWIYRKKWFNLILCIGILIVTLTLISHPLYVPARIHHDLYPPDSINCHRQKRESLQDISDIDPIKGNSIFFVETSCHSFFNNKITISSRQACAVESAAKMNPDMQVYLLFASPGTFAFEGDESDMILQALMEYENVRIMHVDFERYMKDTPLEELYNTGIIENSNFPIEHASDVLRYLTLWKYGGTYLDLDVIVIKPLKDLLHNYAGAESEEIVGASVLNFSPTGVGHDLAESCLNDLRTHFNGRNWGNNGPGVITRQMRNICDATKAKDMITKDCYGFTVYPEKYFYPIPFWNWRMYFNSSVSEAVLNLTKSSYVIHVWNKFSRSTKIPKTSRAPYLMFAKKYCTKVVKQCKFEF